MNQSRDYPLGYSEEEARRLAKQAEAMEEFTADTLRRAGLRSGMRVLDIGCGLGDVSLIAGKIVGEEGSVLGIDRATSSLETARRRAVSLGLDHVRFEEVDVTSFQPEGTFDAIVGRFVLLYLPQPTETLRRLVRSLRPGGIVAFQELDMSQISQSPASGLFLQTRRLILDAFAAAGAEVDMGTKLYPTFVHAGLPAPEMIATTLVIAGSDTAGYTSMVEVLRSLLPVIERNGIAIPEELDLQTLGHRLLSDALANDRVGFMSRLVSAWTARELRG